MNEIAWSDIVSLMNGCAVGVFGMVLSAAFCDILWTKKKQFAFLFSMAALLLFQGAVYVLADSETVQALYPLITHLPLAMVLYLFSKKKIWVCVSVFAAYLCCQLRRWLALLIVAVAFEDSAMIQDIAELVLTVPLFVVLMRYIAPAVASLSRDVLSIQLQFGIVPLLAYAFDYVTQVYGNSFSKGSPVVAEFMFFVCSGAYLIFVLHTSQETKKRLLLEQAQDNLNLQVTQAVREVGLLRESQRQTSVYRHDLRHHLQYLATCIENGQTEHAQAYIHEICSEIEAGKVTVYCENEAANLIFSAFAARVKECGIRLKVHAELPQSLPVNETDLCVLFSNALENALHACCSLKDKGIIGEIEVLSYEQNGKLFVQIVNSCGENILFNHGIPVTDAPGHGLGVRSICALVDRYNGIYSFSVNDGQFTLRISI